MRYLLSMLLMLCASLGFAQTITDVDFSVDGNNIVVTYNLSDCESCDIGLFVSTDGGLIFSSNSLSNVYGDIGAGVTTGSKRIVWNPSADYPNGINGYLVFEVRSMGNVKEEAGSRLTFTANGVSFEMIHVDGGTFSMGGTSEQGGDAYVGEKPVRQVTLSDYYIGKTEVTQEQWQAIMGSNPSKHKGINYPVENVSWIKVQEFISKLNSITGQIFKLPTEAQWEYAARGGRKSCGYKYNGSNNIDDVAWYKDNSGNKLHTVATKQPNELGIYDMSGNVWEWCSDWYGKYDSSSQTDPRGAYSGSLRVNRGGSFRGNSKYCRVSCRNFGTPDNRSSIIGFRIALAQ